MQRICEQCGAGFTPKKLKQRYCNRKCSTVAVGGWDKHLEYVLQQWGKQGAKEIAAHLEVGHRALLSRVTRWRQEGHNFPRVRTKDTNAMTWRIDRGKRRMWRKGDDGKWKKIPLVKEQQTTTKPKTQKMITTPSKQSATSKSKQHRKEKQQRMAQRTFKTKPVDMSKLIPVHIPQLRLTVHVKPGRDKQQVINKYLDQREFEKGRIGQMNY